MSFRNFTMHAVCGGAVLLASASAIFAQVVNWINPGAGDWSSGSNWAGPFGNAVPEAQFGESANISNGGTASLASGAPAVGGVTLAQTAGQTGTLDVQNGGVLSVVAQAGTTGAVAVGPGGTGSLIVQSGGSLSAVSLTSGAGESGTIHMIGPNVGLSASSASLLAQSTFITEITSTAFAPLTVSGNAALGGTYRFEFSGGFTPSVGNSWSIIDAATVSGAFATIDISAAPALPLGQQFVVASRSGGLGTLVELRLEQVLLFTVDRTNGAVTVSNAVGGTPVKLDGYTIASSAGSLNVSGWDSLQSQAQAGWIEANPTANRLSELGDGDITLNGGNSFSLGNAYAPGTPAFGTPVEDLSFQYSNPDDGSLIEGVVTFTGGVQKFNNLVLEINSSGAAQIFNDSHASVRIDGYSIFSSDGSLLFGNSNWNSLDDQNAAGGDWIEANGAAERLTELKADGATQFNSTNGVSLGSIFNVGGDPDGISFEFLIEGESTPFQGGVAFRNLSAITPIGSGGITGDYNNDGVVDAADYVVWRDHLGSTVQLPNDSTPGSVTQDDYLAWKNNFGASAGSGSGSAGVAAVPEPAAMWLTLLALMSVVALHRSRTSLMPTMQHAL